MLVFLLLICMLYCEYYIFFSVLMLSRVNFCFSVLVIRVDNVRWLLCMVGLILFFNIGYVL